MVKTGFHLVLVAVFMLLGVDEVKAQASACVAGETQQQVTIPAGAWPPGSVGPYVLAIGTGINAITATFTVTNPTPFSGGTPNQAQHGGLANVVRAGHTVTGTNVSLSTQTVTFSRPINKFTFVATDVDYAAGNWQDVVVARANGTVVPTSMTGGANHTINLVTGTATATGSFNCSATDASCNVTSNFNINGITSASEEFRTGTLHGGAQQFVGWTSFGMCVPNLSNIRLIKTWTSAAFNDAVTVVATGATPAVTNLLSVVNNNVTGNETDQGILQTVLVGSVLNLSETFTTGNATNYATTLACTGTAGLVGNTLTVGNADTNIACTYTNRSIAAALTITKTDSKVIATSGGTNNYVISILNAGPGAADGVIVTDVAVSGLTCPASNPVSCSDSAGGTICPSGTLTFANLSSGITVANFPRNSSLQFTFTCNVN